MGNYYITHTEKAVSTCGQHGIHVVINDAPLSIWRAFKNMAELDRFAFLLGFEYRECNRYYSEELGDCIVYEMSHYIDDSYYRLPFKSLAELPPGAQKMTLVENGELVTGYFTNNGGVITIFRPNCNYKEVYRLY